MNCSGCVVKELLVIENDVDSSGWRRDGGGGEA